MFKAIFLAIYLLIGSLFAYKPLPKENAIYLGSLNGSQVLFYTNNYIHKNSDAYQGSVLSLDNKLIVKPQLYDFKDIKNPKIIYQTSDFNLTAINFAFNSSQTIFYLPVYFFEKGENYRYDGTEKIFQFNLSDLSYKQLFDYKSKNNKYGNAFGGISFPDNSVFDDKYLVFYIHSCSECDSSAYGIIVLNINTGKEIYLPGIDNVQVDVTKGVFTYQKLQPDINSDFPSAGKPGGAILSDTLPKLKL